MPVAFSILLVDDEPLVRVVMSRALQAAGYEVVSSGDGEEAWAMAQSHHIDLAVVDTVMPRMGGPELVKLLRERQPDLPIIHISGFLDAEAAREYYPSDVPTIGKPFHLQLLLQLVEDVLARGPMGGSDQASSRTVV